MSNDEESTISNRNEQIETVKPKRLPRSQKKRLRYERIRQQRKEKRKTKKKLHTSEKHLTEQILSNTKDVRRAGNERLAEINQQTTVSTICIDCAYNETMSKKELASLARQIGRCYSSNRRATNPVRFILTNWSDNSPLADECRRVNSGFNNFQLILNEKPVYESFPIENLVYLSPNGEKMLTEFDENKIHIIGGLVDESVRKNATFEICQNKNISCYRLPIEMFMKHSVNGGTFNQILSINQVFDILLNFLTTKNWPEALKAYIPERKGWIVKGRKFE